MPEYERGICRHCGETRRLRKDGTIGVHPYRRRSRCDGSGYPPVHEQVDWAARAHHAERVLARLEDLPVIRVGGRAAVYLDDLQPIISAAQAFREQGEAADA